MVDIPLDHLLEIGWADLRSNQAQFKQVAHELELTRFRPQCSKTWEKIIPLRDKLLDSFRATFTGLMQFIRAHSIVTIPSDIKPIVQETPPFMRATHVRQHGYSGTVRDARNRGLLLRHAP